MKTKYTVILALMLCVGAFLFPAHAYAAENSDPITVTARIEGDVLRIEATGGVTGVEAIFINETRFNFRVDGALIMDLLAYEDSETISVYALDFAGNKSNVVGLINPMYIGLTRQPEPEPQGIPVTASNPFTPTGQASVLDNAHDGDEKEFFTFQTPEGNVFFLIVDRQRGADNVYFLNAVTELDLMALAEQSGTPVSGNGGIPVSTAPQTTQEQPAPETTETPEPPPAEKGGSNGTLIFLLIAMAVAGGVGYYLKIVRPKQQGQTDGDYDDEDDDEEDIGDEMQFEDESNEQGDSGDGGDYYNTDDGAGDEADGESDGDGDADSDDEPEIEDDGL